MRWLDPNSRFTVTLRRLRGRFGISAPRMAVRTHVPWHVRAASMIVIIGLSLALAGWVYDAGRRFSGFDRGASEEVVTGLHTRISELEAELGRARAIADTSDAKVNIEKTAQEQLAAQVRQLEGDNAKLKEDLAVFENMAQSAAVEGALNISSVRVEPEDSAGGFRYRVLVTQQIGKKGRDFRGSLQLSLTVQQSGRSVMIALPQPTDQNASQYSVSFKYFQRLEGVFKVPAGSQLESVEARLLQDGVVKARRRVAL